MTRYTILALAALVACDTTEPQPGTTPSGTTPAAGATLRWSIDGLEPLGEGFVYEGWAIVDGAPVSVGRFSVDASGTPDLDAFTLSAEQVAGLETYVLTIEPETGDDPAPSDVKLLGADLDADGNGDLSVAHPAAIGTDFSDAMASFILETPSTMEPSDFSLGIWFLDPAAGPGPSLSLPELPVGWTYEGWVVDANGPISTGTFASGDGADSDAGGPDAGPEMTPPFPGQDFIDPALDLIGLTAVISVEPVPDDSPAPFVLKPLVDMIIEDVGGGVLQDMSNDDGASNPTGMIWLDS